MNRDEQTKTARRIADHITATMGDHIAAGHIPADWTAAEFWLWALLLIQDQQAESMRDGRTARVKAFYYVFLTRFLDRRTR